MGRCFHAAFDQPFEINFFPPQSKFTTVQPRRAQQARTELTELSGMLIDQNDQPLFRTSQSIHRQQARACAANRRQWTLEGVRKATQNSYAKLFTLPRCLAAGFGRNSA